MNISEFSNEFDVLYNNIMSNQAPGLDEYEKSVFLTKAQSEIVKSYFSPKSNKVQDGFDGSVKRQYDFSNLIRTATLQGVNKWKERISELEKTDSRSHVFLFPENYFLSINEIISDSTQMYSVQPLSYEEYQRLMLKPYALPTKRAAWRLFTDKKNCNYIQEYVKVSAGGETKTTNCDYNILSSWADQKRNIVLNVKTIQDTTVPSQFRVTDNLIQFLYNDGAEGLPVKIIADCGYSDDKLSYTIDLVVRCASMLDDEEIFKVLKQGFNHLLTDKNESGTRYIDLDYEISKAATHLDGLDQAEAPGKFKAFQNAGGKTFTTKIIELPIAEIIGKFNGPIIYKLRYIRRPNPIILTDLSSEGVSINGHSQITECELASELHPEILQRAVELAKASYAGDLSATISVGNASATDKGVIPSNK